MEAFASDYNLGVALGLEDSDLVALVRVYFDDSGTHRKSEIAIAACYVSDVRRWTAYESEWLSVLTDAGIEKSGFHMADFVAHDKPFDTWDENKRNRVFRALLSIVNKYAYEGAIAAVIKSDYDRLVTGNLRKKLGEYHYTFVVQSCLAHLEYFRKCREDSQPFQYVFDMMSEGKHEIIDLFDDILKHRTAVAFGLEPKGYAFQSAKTTLELQAVDILAWEANKYMRDCQFTGKTPRKSFQSLVDNVHTLARFFDASSLSSMVSDLTRKYEAVNWEGPLGGFFEPGV